MKPEMKANLRKLFWHLLMALCVAVYAAGLAIVCDAAGRQDFATFRTFVATDLGLLVLKNTAVLAGLLILAMYFLVRRIWLAMALVSVPALIFHIISAFKLILRNEPFYPWDFNLAGEATNIISSVALHPTKMMIAAAVYVAASLLVALVLDLWVLRRNRPGTRASLAAFAAMTAAFGLLAGHWLSEGYIQEHTIPVRMYNQRWTYEENGFVYAFAANVYVARQDAPADYSAEAIRAEVQDYSGSEGSVEPNVIVVMSEAFADIWNAKELQFDEPLAPTYLELAEQYPSGNCLTSEYGGSTANCEFEVLTGYSTYQMPSGIVPYMSYLNQQTDNYTTFLQSRGYYTLALHPYQRSFFSREKAYGLMGFQDFYSEEHFEGAERVRYMKYVSDDDLADRIIEEFERNQQTDRGFFCHVVTMMNHTSYHKSDWPEETQVGMTASCELTEKEYDVLRCYATGVQLEDQMLAKLVDYFSDVEEPTVLLFFGDHQPSLGTPGYELMLRIGYVEDNTSLEGILALQSTPYLIWNNYQTEPRGEKMDLSMFHLVPYMTRLLDLPRPAFHSYMDGLFELTRGVTRQISLDGSGTPVLTLEGEAKAAFDEYLNLVYDGLLGKQYGNEYLYP